MLTVVSSIDDPHIKQVLEKTLSDLSKTGDFEISVSVVDAQAMAELHNQYMAKQGYEEELHEVISFPTEEGPGPDGVTRLGDIVICDQFLDQMDFLLDHACRHLLGIHHE